ncbi:MAG: ROK family protein [Candidatus Limnocylindria bacterium]
MEHAPRRAVLAIDLGGTQIRAAHVAADLTVSCRHAVPTDSASGVEDVVERLCALASEALTAARVEGLEAPIGIGISAPGPLDPWAGVVVSPPNLAAWHNVPLARLVSARLGLPTFLERDTNVAVMAEWRFGAAQGARTVVYVTISTGIGGGIVIDARPLIGLDGTAGEVGHLTVDIDGPLCGDGQRGHAEAIGSGIAIRRDGMALLEQGASPTLAALVSDPQQLSARDVADAADSGDAACAAIYERAYVAVGAMCAGLVNLLNPEVIVLGGSIAEHRPQLHVVVGREIAERSFPRPAARVRLEHARFSDDVSLIGALPIVNERIADPAYRRASA